MRRRQFADGYHNASWPPVYYEELAKIRMNWHPYSYWLAAPFSSRYINIGSDGLRHTWQSKSFKPKCGGRPARIFIFGGSTTFGEGARDDYTVPSQLQRILDASSHCIAVTNFGQEGYVSTPELLLLEEQLRKGNVPDLVIFYDGVNDTESSLLEGEAGVTYDEIYRKREFGIQNWFEPERRGKLCEMALLTFAMHSALGETAKWIQHARFPGEFRLVKGELVQKKLSSRSGVDRNIERLGDSVISVYLGNHAIAEALAQKYGFHEFSYWQPTVFQKNCKTPYKRSAAEAYGIYKPIIDWYIGGCRRFRQRTELSMSAGFFAT